MGRRMMGRKVMGRMSAGSRKPKSSSMAELMKKARPRRRKTGASKTVVESSWAHRPADQTLRRTYQPWWSRW